MKKLLVLLFVLACGGATAPDPNAQVLGTYALTMYSGANLPTQGIVSGSMSLFADHYEFTYSGATQPNAYDERGTWRLTGAALVLHSMTAVNGSTPPDWSGTAGRVEGTSGFTAISMNAETNPSWTNLHPAMLFTR